MNFHDLILNIAIYVNFNRLLLKFDQFMDKIDIFIEFVSN
jgi:hypothetical protein